MKKYRQDHSSVFHGECLYVIGGDYDHREEGYDHRRTRLNGSIEMLSFAEGSKQSWKIIMTHESLRLYQSALFVLPKD